MDRAVDPARGEEGARELELAHEPRRGPVGEVEDRDLGRVAVAHRHAVVAVAAVAAVAVVGVLRRRVRGAAVERGVDERAVAVDEELLRRALELDPGDLLRLRGRPGAEDPERAAARVIDEVAVGLDQVGLVDAGDLVVGLGVRGRGLLVRGAARLGGGLGREVGPTPEPVRAAVLARREARGEVGLQARDHLADHHLPELLLDLGAAPGLAERGGLGVDVALLALGPEHRCSGHGIGRRIDHVAGEQSDREQRRKEPGRKLSSSHVLTLHRCAAATAARVPARRLPIPSASKRPWCGAASDGPSVRSAPRGGKRGIPIIGRACRWICGGHLLGPRSPPVWSHKHLKLL